MNQAKQSTAGSDGLVFEHLQQALEAAKAEEKNYHIRQAQQLLLTEDD